MALIKYIGIELEGKSVLILGTGGTSDTAYAVCKAMGAKKIQKVSKTGKDGSITYQEAVEREKDADVIINTTPCGMYPNNYSAAIDLCKFNKLEGVVDVVYNPLRTALVSQALELGIKAQGGLYMLVAQAVRASEFFLGKNYDDAIIEKIYKNLLVEKTNIVLTGMPASGKTTIGKLLAKELGRSFVDTDDLIEEKAKTTIKNIFAQCGEEAFRNLETEAVKEVSKNCGIVIATGGGAILREENVKALKQNGLVFFLDRDVEKLIPTDSRPTASDKEAILKRFEERYTIYQSTADLVIENDESAEASAKKILEVF